MCSVLDCTVVIAVVVAYCGLADSTLTILYYTRIGW